jgi:ESCRT-II complex subunit VPS22
LHSCKFYKIAFESMANKILFDVLGQIVNSSGPLPVNSQVLGSGFEVISVGKKKLVRSVPTELNKDHNGILELAQAEGFVTVEQVERKFSWSTGRAIDVLETLLKEGLAMIDDGHRDGKRRYWFPCVTLSSDSTGADAKS